MKVYGTEISAAQISCALAAMSGTFTMKDVERALIHAGVPEPDCSTRAADRLLQRERKAGRIAPNPENKRQWIARERSTTSQGNRHGE